jgi:hypothetical protein
MWYDENGPVSPLRLVQLIKYETRCFLQRMKLVTVITKAIILWTHFTTEEVNYLAKKEVQRKVVTKMLTAWGRDFQAHLWATRAF